MNPERKHRSQKHPTGIMQWETSDVFSQPENISRFSFVGDASCSPVGSTEKGVWAKDGSPGWADPAGAGSTSTCQTRRCKTARQSKAPLSPGRVPAGKRGLCQSHLLKDQT